MSANGLTNAWLAEKLEVSRQMVAKYRTGSVPGTVLMQRLSTVLGVDVPTMTGRREEPVPVRIHSPGIVREEGVAYVTESAMAQLGELVHHVGDDAELKIRVLAILRELEKTALKSELSNIRDLQDELLGTREPKSSNRDNS